MEEIVGIQVEPDPNDPVAERIRAALTSDSCEAQLRGVLDLYELLDRQPLWALSDQLDTLRAALADRDFGLGQWKLDMGFARLELMARDRRACPCNAIPEGMPTAYYSAPWDRLFEVVSRGGAANEQRSRVTLRCRRCDTAHIYTYQSDGHRSAHHWKRLDSKPRDPSPEGPSRHAPD